MFSSGSSGFNPLMNESTMDEDKVETQDSYIDQSGAIFYCHDIIFEEELHYLAKDRIQEKNSLETV